MTQVTPDMVVDAARRYIDTPWKHQGRKIKVGVDCIGLVGGVALDLGLPGASEWASDKTLHCYGRTPVPETLLGACDRFMDRVRIPEASLGDIIIMGFSYGPQHFAIVSRVAPNYIIHAYAQMRKVMETKASIHGAQIVRAYRFKGVR